MQLFISWSGERSKAVAYALKDWIPKILHYVQPWMSEIDIASGTSWIEEFEEAVKQSEFAIVCLTKSNINSPWLLYEAGYLTRSGKTYLCPYLIDVAISDMARSPLHRYQARTADKMGTLNLIRHINKAQREKTIPESVLIKSFNVFWPKLKQTLEYLPNEELFGDINKLLDLSRVVRRPISTSKDPEPVRESVKLFLSNPSAYARKGYVTTAWQPIFEVTHISPEELVLSDKAGNLLWSQVDYVVPDDISTATLVFSLNEEVLPGYDLSMNSPLITIGRGKSLKLREDAPSLEIEKAKGQARRVKLINNRLEVVLELFPDPSNSYRDWFAGSASSVLLDGRQFLDEFNALLSLSDYEKRCMQIDKLFYADGQQISALAGIINRPYELISQSSGPIRATVTIASSIFNYNYSNPNTGKHISGKCRLYRTISMYNDAEYLVEELRLREVSAAGKDRKGYMNIPFGVRYFSYIDFGLDRYRLNPVPEWLVMGSNWFPFPGYGFATNTAVRSFQNPHLSFPDNGNRHKTFSWELHPEQNAKCLHFFAHNSLDELQIAVGRVWYEVIKEPLTAHIKK